MMAPIELDDDRSGPIPRPPSRGLAVTLAVIAAACLIAASFSHRWLTNRRAGDFGYSPLSYEQCGPECTASTNYQVYETASHFPFEENRISIAFPIAGIAAFMLLLFAAAGLIASAALAIMNQRPDLPVSPTTFALLGLMLGLIAGCVFVGTRPGPAGAVGVGWSFWAFGIGSVAGLAGAALLARQIRPADPDLLHDAMDADEF